MTKDVVKYEINVPVDKHNAKTEVIAEIVIQFYLEATMQVHIWHEVPVVHIIVESDETTLQKMVSKLQSVFGDGVNHRPAPFYLYE